MELRKVHWASYLDPYGLTSLPFAILGCWELPGLGSSHGEWDFQKLLLRTCSCLQQWVNQCVTTTLHDMGQQSFPQQSKTMIRYPKILRTRNFCQPSSWQPVGSARNGTNEEETNSVPSGKRPLLLGSSGWATADDRTALPALGQSGLRPKKQNKCQAVQSMPQQVGV